MKFTVKFNFESQLPELEVILEEGDGLARSNFEYFKSLVNHPNKQLIEETLPGPNQTVITVFHFVNK